MAAVRTAALLSAMVTVAGCGSTVVRNRADVTRTTFPAEVIKRRLEANTPNFMPAPEGSTLARIGLPGGGMITIVAIRCPHSEVTCYELAEYLEEPARRGRGVHKKHGIVSTDFAGTGPAITHAGPAEHTALDMVVRHGCAGAYRYASAYGILRGRNDIVVDRAEGKTTIMNKVAIPAQLHPEGVLVDGLLLPGSNEIEVRTPNGTIVSDTRWAGSNEEVSCRASTEL